MQRALKILIASAGLAVVAGLPAPAHAATALVADPAGDVPASFSDEVDLTAVGVTWTDRLVVRVTYATPPPTAALRLSVSSAAADELDPAVHECDPDADDAFTVTADESSAVLEDPSIIGELSAPPAWEGTTVTYVFSSPALTRRYDVDGSDPFVCLEAGAGRDDVFGAFDGRALKLTTAVVEDGMRRAIGRRHGEAAASGARVRCLSRGAREPYEGDEYLDATPALRWCAFEARVTARQVVIGEGAVHLAHGRPLVRHLYGRRYPAGTRDCGMTDFSNGRWLLAPFPENFGGAFLAVTARRVSCPAARRLARRSGRRIGAFRCMVLKSGHEYLRTRCSAPRGRIVWIETGA